MLPQAVLTTPALRPGLRVFRRDADQLQIGLDAPRLVLPDTDGVRRLLEDLRAGTGLRAVSPEAGVALDLLHRAGLLVEAGDLATRRPERLAELARHGPGARARLAARGHCPVRLIAPEPWRATVADWLADAGLPLAGPDREPPGVALLVSPGEPPRSHLDSLMRADLPHLLVALHPDRATLGPFVVPGVTACLRCVDAHLAEHDPRRALVLQQLEEPDPAPAPHDALVAHAAAALAAREVATYADGDRPGTWSATLTIGSGLTTEHRSWPRHPHCGCSWA